MGTSKIQPEAVNGTSRKECVCASVCVCVCEGNVQREESDGAQLWADGFTLWLVLNPAALCFTEIDPFFSDYFKLSVTHRKKIKGAVQYMCVLQYIFIIKPWYLIFLPSKVGINWFWILADLKHYITLLILFIFHWVVLIKVPFVCFHCLGAQLIFSSLNACN